MSSSALPLRSSRSSDICGQHMCDSYICQMHRQSKVEGRKSKVGKESQLEVEVECRPAAASQPAAESWGWLLREILPPRRRPLRGHFSRSTADCRLPTRDFV